MDVTMDALECVEQDVAVSVARAVVQDVTEVVPVVVGW